jgi:transcriptional regulator with XRE-family HTH domain
VGGEAVAISPRGPCPEAEQRSLILFQRRPSPLRLEAYLASALSGLTDEQRKLIFGLSDLVARVCANQDINLYEPRRATDPINHPLVPPQSVFRTDRERVLASDLVIHLCHFPSTGSGEELDIAYSSLIPTVLISHSSCRVSRMVTGIPQFKVEIKYADRDDLEVELTARLAEIRPILEQRKMAFSEYNVNLVGDKIRSLREELGLTREEVAAAVPHLTEEALSQIEESVDRISNPTLLQLRQIATVLKTTVADLVEPDLGERMVVALEEWVESRQAARFQAISVRDRNRIIRRVLLRVIDSLESD